MTAEELRGFHEAYFTNLCTSTNANLEMGDEGRQFALAATIAEFAADNSCGRKPSAPPSVSLDYIRSLSRGLGVMAELLLHYDCTSAEDITGYRYGATIPLLRIKGRMAIAPIWCHNLDIKKMNTARALLGLPALVNEGKENTHND